MSRKSSKPGRPSRFSKVTPRKLARSMAKARTGLGKLSLFDWRAAAVDQAEHVRKKGRA